MTSSPVPAPVPAGSIVVGVDGSPSSDQSIHWAAHQAGLEHRPLTLVHAAHLGAEQAGLTATAGVDVPQLRRDLAEAGRELLARAASAVALVHPGVEVRTVVSSDDPRQALLDLALDAALVVVGSRGRGPVASLLLGSVSVAVSDGAACPVVVVRHATPARPGAGVLVGVDTAGGSRGAVELAYRVASWRALPLTAMLVFRRAGFLPSRGMPVTDHQPGLEDLREALSAAVAGMGEKYPDVAARTVLVRGYLDHELVRASHGMDLVVVGARPRGLLGELVHGAAAPTVVEDAACDVAVVPVGQHGPRGRSSRA